MYATKKVFLSYEGKTVKDGYYLSFTFDAENFKRCRDYIKRYAFNHWDRQTCDPKANLALTIPIGEIFNNLDSTGRTMIECPWFYNIGTWSDYSKFIGSGIKLERNEKCFSKRNVRESIKEVIEDGVTLGRGQHRAKKDIDSVIDNINNRDE
jgi:hypothetical protein